MIGLSGTSRIKSGPPLPNGEMKKRGSFLRVALIKKFQIKMPTMYINQKAQLHCCRIK